MTIQYRTLQQPDYQELRQRILGFLRRRVRDSHSAEDLAQDVLLKLHVHSDQLPADPRLRLAWALRAARNAAIDWYRSNRRAPVMLESVPEAPDLADDPRRQLAGCLTPMLRHIPEHYRTAVEMADLRGWPQKEVAQRLGISLSGVKSRVQRGRRQLRSVISQCCDIEIGRHGDVRSVEPTERSAEFCGDSQSCVLSQALSS